MKLFFELMDLLNNLFLIYGNPYAEEKDLTGMETFVKQSGETYDLRKGSK